MRITTSAILACLLAALPVRPFSCTFTASSIDYDLTPLGGLRTSVKSSDTPPTTSEAKVLLDLCGDSGLPREEGISDEDQCPDGSRACIKLLNHKPSASDPDRITAVIPVWAIDTPEDEIWKTPIGKNGVDGVKIYVQGQDYAGVRQHLNLTLLCDPSGSDPNPSIVSYVAGLVSLQWSTPDACPRDGSLPPGSSPSGGGGGLGFFGFLKFLFWVGFIGLFLYFAIGIFYNHQQYSAKGWDLIPHRDFWREFPVLIQDLFSHVFAGLRGGNSGRGGYSSLG